MNALELRLLKFEVCDAGDSAREPNPLVVLVVAVVEAVDVVVAPAVALVSVGLVPLRWGGNLFFSLTDQPSYFFSVFQALLFHGDS